MDTDWAWVAGVASVTSKLVDQGWAWAALAVAAGWLAGTSVVRGALAGVVALLAATAAYLGMDAVLLDNSLAWFWRGMLRWWFASAVFGPPLGAMGANIKRPGVIGLLAGLTVPAGAAVQMIVLPPSSTPPTGVPGAICARVIVWVASAAAAGVVITRFGAAKSGRR